MTERKRESQKIAQTLAPKKALSRRQKQLEEQKVSGSVFLCNDVMCPSSFCAPSWSNHAFASKWAPIHSYSQVSIIASSMGHFVSSQGHVFFSRWRRELWRRLIPKHAGILTYTKHSKVPPLLEFHKNRLALKEQVQEVLVHCDPTRYFACLSRKHDYSSLSLYREWLKRCDGGNWKRHVNERLSYVVMVWQVVHRLVFDRSQNWGEWKCLLQTTYEISSLNYFFFENGGIQYEMDGKEKSWNKAGSIDLKLMYEN